MQLKGEGVLAKSKCHGKDYWWQPKHWEDKSHLAMHLTLGPKHDKMWDQLLKVKKLDFFITENLI